PLQPFERGWNRRVDPAEHRRPPARTCAGKWPAGQSRPMLARPQVMLDVVAVVEEQPVIEPAVVAGRPCRVLEVALQPAQAEAKRIAGHVDADEEARRQER